MFTPHCWVELIFDFCLMLYCCLIWKYKFSSSTNVLVFFNCFKEESSETWNSEESWRQSRGKIQGRYSLEKLDSSVYFESISFLNSFRCNWLVNTLYHKQGRTEASHCISCRIFTLGRYASGWTFYLSSPSIIV